jgi:Na+-driven multidrug efflux pump
VGSRLGAGDLKGAKDSSDKAKMWCWIAFGTGLVLILLAFCSGLFTSLSAWKEYLGE